MSKSSWAALIMAISMISMCCATSPNAQDSETAPPDSESDSEDSESETQPDPVIGPQPNPIWAQPIGGEESLKGVQRIAEYAGSVSAVAGGGMVVGGQFVTQAIIGTGKQKVILNASEYFDADGYVLRFDGSGTPLWGVAIGGLYPYGEPLGPPHDGVGTVRVLPDNTTMVHGWVSANTATVRGAKTELALSKRSSFLTKIDETGEPIWARSIAGVGGSPVNDGAFGPHPRASFNSEGAAVTAGYFVDTVVFGQGEKKETTLATMPTDKSRVDAYLARYAPDGAFHWVRQIGGDKTLGEEVHSVTIAENGDVFLLGYFLGESIVLDMNEQSGTSIAVMEAGTDASTLFLARFTSNGTPLWATSIPEIVHYGNDVVVLDDMSTVVCGNSYEDAFSDTDDDIGADKPFQMFLAKFDADGNRLWAKPAAALGSATCYGTTVLADGSIAVTGRFRVKVTFGVGDLYQITLDGTEEENIFVARYDSEGNLLWAVDGGSPNREDEGFDITTLDDGNLALVGNISGPAENTCNWIGELGPGELFFSSDNPQLLTTTTEWDGFVLKFAP